MVRHTRHNSISISSSNSSSSISSMRALCPFVVWLILILIPPPPLESFSSCSVSIARGNGRDRGPFRACTAIPGSPWKNEETPTVDETGENGSGRDSLAAAAVAAADHNDDEDEDDGDDDDDPPFFSDWPIWLQHSIRDSGGVGWFLDTVTRTIAAPAFYKQNPWCLPEFLRISGTEYSWIVAVLRWVGVISENQPGVNFEKVSYGDHPSQVAQVMISNDAKAAEDSSGRAAPLFVFLHGGAWGSGFPTMYRLLSLPFLERGFRSAILGYRTYPSATIEGQVDDLVKALELLLGRHCGVGSDRGPVVLVGHSSGAHVCLLAALTGRLPSSVDALVGASGVYDLNAQLDAEVATGVNEISPLSPCNGFARANLDAVSPVKLLLLPEHLPKTFPEVLLVHGDADTVVSPQSSRDFATALGEDRCKLKILKGVGHQEVVLDTCLGGTSRTVIFDWIESTVGVGS